MPQLGPVNWLFVYVFFWFILVLVSVVFWWMKSNCFVLKGASDGEGEIFNSSVCGKDAGLFWKW
uniref:ATPase subuint 8 n=1 Tax=Cellana nigrlineata TaxID=1933376 RepID=A0A7R7YPA6_9GAST|nr:ATPase subuint 8 [Cellana nigrolineata]